MYRSAAILTVPPEIAAADVAEYALRAFQDEHWSKNPGILSGSNLSRPATVGDVFIISESKAEVVVSSGFKKLERFWPSGAYEEVSRPNYTSSGPSL